jgi:hypothetical protein
MRTPSVFVLIAFRTFRRRSALSAPRSINLWLRPTKVVGQVFNLPRTRKRRQAKKCAPRHVLQ